MQDRVCAWHIDKFPDATIEDVVLKLCEEVGDIAKSINRVNEVNLTGYGNIGEETAEVVISLFVLLGRWFPEVDFTRAIISKIGDLETITKQELMVK